MKKRMIAAILGVLMVALLTSCAGTGNTGRDLGSMAYPSVDTGTHHYDKANGGVLYDK